MEAMGSRHTVALRYPSSSSAHFPVSVRQAISSSFERASSVARSNRLNLSRRLRSSEICSKGNTEIQSSESNVGNEVWAT